MKGKISGFIEVLELPTPKVLNTSSSYYFPVISDINSLKYLQLSIGEIKENIYLNFMLDNNNSPFEIYENGQKN